VAVITSDKHRYKLLFKFRLVHMTTVNVGIVLVKISVYLFLLRLMTRRAQTWFLWGIICSLVPFVLASLSTLVCQFRHSTEENESLIYNQQVFRCSPIAAAWDMDLRPPPMGNGTAKCFSGDTFDANGLFNGSMFSLRTHNAAYYLCSYSRQYIYRLPPRSCSRTFDMEAPNAASHAPLPRRHSLPRYICSRRRDH
jgi:uncharacterized membrane protein YeiB